MSISGIGNYSQLSQVFGLDSIDQISGLNGSSPRNSSSKTTSTSDKSSMSQMGQMMSQLLQLSSTDPDKFKELAQQISDDLSTQASNATTIQQSRMLSSMSSKFATAAQTGSMESLKPEGPPPPPPSGSSSSSSGASGMDATFSQVNQAIAADLSNAGISMSSTSLQGPEAMAEFVKKLESLQSSDPEKFKELTGKIASDLSSLSDSSTDPGAAHMLSDLSSQFSQASSTGSTDSLQPQGPPPPPPPSGQSASDDQSGSAYNSASFGQNSQDMLEYLKSIMANDLSGLYSSGFWNSVGTTTTSTSTA